MIRKYILTMTFVAATALTGVAAAQAMDATVSTGATVQTDMSGDAHAHSDTSATTMGTHTEAEVLTDLNGDGVIDALDAEAAKAAAEAEGTVNTTVDTIVDTATETEAEMDAEADAGLETGITQ